MDKELWSNVKVTTDATETLRSNWERSHYHVISCGKTIYANMAELPFNIPVDMVVGVEVVQTSGAPRGYQTPLAPRQRRAFILEGN